MVELRGIIPARWQVRPNPDKVEVFVIVDWLEREVDAYKIPFMPKLAVLSGWRNREVYRFITDGDDWTARIFG